MVKVIGYIRVSTQEQADRGVSLAAQTAKLEAYASLYDLEIVEIVVDGGHSGKTLDRPGMTQVCDMLRRRKADGVLILKLDRLTRSVADLNRLIEEFFSERAGRMLFSVSDHIDTRSAAGRLVLNVLASVGQWERETVAERTSAALQYKKSQGQRVGSVPLGYSLDTDGKTLVESEAGQRVIGMVKELRESGLSLRQIVDELNIREIPTAQGKKWHLATVQRVLRQAA
jgi:hypothetical protein